ncbi:Eco57I restriction-modification methylase domain-containing protein [Mycobacterium avium]|uniref:Eco57I restriction-modification methylase domain-containing protein n=1 Tax=Mycobacterium avium TaxID=1764 RepID=UPI0012DA74FA|nr:Eco57I restriction-modification methylase domain-containing protein [Mycobacterium avium]
MDEILGGVPGWWAQRAQAAGLSGKWLDVTQVISGAVAPDHLPATSIDLQGSAEQLGEQYVAALPVQDRSDHGRHYTPMPLAAELWEKAKRALGWKRPQPLPGLVRDPACGAGALLLPVLREHLGAAARTDPQLALAALPNLIEGIDNDPNAVWLANVLLAAEMLPILAITPRARRRPLPALARVGDGLAEQQERALVSLMNPPYGRVKLATGERQRFADYLYGHANLYGLFMAAGLESLEPAGVLAALVPTSFLSGRYFEAQRAAFAAKAPLREVGFVVDRAGVFNGVLQETCLATFSPRRSRRVAINTVNGTIIEVARVATPKSSGPWVLPRRADDALAAAAAIRMPMTLATAGWKASTGPLVWNRRKADITADHPGDGAAPILWAADIDGGVIHRDRVRDSQRYLKLRGTDWAVMTLDEPAVLVQRTTAPEQSRRLVPAELTKRILDEWGGAVVVENHVNVLRPTTDSPAISYATLTRVLATQTLDRVMRSLSGSVAVSAYELAAIPLPSVDVLRTWDELTGDALEQAVKDAYRPVSV